MLSSLRTLQKYPTTASCVYSIYFSIHGIKDLAVLCVYTIVIAGYFRITFPPLQYTRTAHECVNLLHVPRRQEGKKPTMARCCDCALNGSWTPYHHRLRPTVVALF